MKLLYTDPKKKTLQKIEIVLMILMLPIGLVWGYGAFRDFQEYKKAEALYMEADVLLHQGNSDEAILKLEKAVAIYPDFYAAWEDLGVAYHMQKDLDKSLDAYERAVKAVPDSGNLRRELATAYHYSGQHKKELEQAKIAVTLPNSDALFTGKVLEMAMKENSGEVKVEEGKRISPPGLPADSNEQSGGDHDDHSGHDHDDHSGHDH